MASKSVMLLGNLASIVVTIAGILQALSWTIAGAIILAILSITTLAPAKRPTSGVTGHSTTRKSIGHAIMAEPKVSRDKTPERQIVRPHQTPPKPELKQFERSENPKPSISQTRSELQKAIAPKITPPKTIPTNISPSKTSPTKAGLPRQDTLRPLPPPTGPSLNSTTKSMPPKIDPNVRIIDRGDYTTNDLQLDQGTEVTCEVAANAPVNAYILDQENLTGLDLGEEFWSERGEENVEKAILSFVAPQSGKWFFVVENTDNKEVSATINVRKNPPKPKSA